MNVQYTLYDFLPSGNKKSPRVMKRSPCWSADFKIGQAYPKIRAWMTRVAAQPRHAPITAA